MLQLISVLLFFGSSAGLIAFLLHGDRGKREAKGPLFAALGFGFLGIVVAFFGELLLLPHIDGKPGISVGTLFITALGVGIIEESAKFVPLALFIKNKGYFNEHTDGIIYFVISGLTFGLVENILYALVYSTQPNGGGAAVGIVRVVVLLFFHAATAGICGYYLIRAKLHHKSMWQPVIALATMASLHGFYDFVQFYAGSRTRDSDPATLLLAVFGIIIGFTISGLLNLCLFLYYRRAKQWDFSMGLAFDPKHPELSRQFQMPGQPMPGYAQPPMPQQYQQPVAGYYQQPPMGTPGYYYMQQPPVYAQPPVPQPVYPPPAPVAPVESPKAAPNARQLHS